MQRRLTEVRRRRAAGDHGFTLIELLVVVVVIGILIAIAIPVYLNYEKSAHDASAGSDVRNAIGVLELCNADNGTFPEKIPSAGGPLDDYGCTDQRINVTDGTRLLYVLSAAQPQSFVILGSNSGGTGKVYCYNSLVGGGVAAMPTSGAATVLDLSAANPAAAEKAVARVTAKESARLCGLKIKGELPMVPLG